tara:strand:- start:9238 stop:14379 length:5142 start_codon:yes stop_codon:yes gene_type:complete
MPFDRPDRRLRQLSQPVTLTYIPSDDYGKNGDRVFFRDEGSNSIEELFKRDGRWYSVTTGRPANDSKRRAGKKGTSDAVATTTVQNITVNQDGSGGTGTGGGTSDHSLLENLNQDNHSQYVHNTNVRTVSASHVFSGNPSFTSNPVFSNTPQFTKADGNTPFTVTSTTKVANLHSDNSDKWDGYQFSDYLDQAVKTTSDVTFGTITATELSAVQGGIHEHDSGNTYSTELRMTPTSLSANRTLSILNGDADRTITVDGNLNIESASIINQDVTTDSDTTFGSTTLSNLTSTRLIASDGSKKAVSTSISSWVAGTTNQITVTDDTDGTATLSTPQDIHTSATPTFASATLGTVNAGASAGTVTTTTGDLVLDSASNTLKINADLDVESSVDVGTNLNVLGNTILGDTTDFSGSADTVEMKANVTIKGGLTVDGTTTTINSTTLSVDDKNIELGTVDSPSNTTADGGGITLKGATDKTINWINSTGSWTSNQPFEVSNQSSQLKLSYDNSNASTLGVDSGGILTIGASDIRFNASGQNVDPSATVHTDLGAYNRMWRSLYAAELYVENLVAQDVMATMGGRIIVAPTTKLIANVTNNATTIDVEHNNITGAYIKLQTAPAGVAQIEIMKVNTGSPTTITGGFRYTVTRNADGSGANSWVEGDAVVNFGASSGEGFIDLTSTTTSLNHLGPNMTIYSRKDMNAWDRMDATVSIGNLESWVDYSSDEFGIAIGMNMLNSPNANSGPFTGLTADRTNGLRLFNTPIEMYRAGVKKVKITSSGGIKLGDQIDGGSEDVKFDWDEDNDKLTISGIIHVQDGSTGMGDDISEGTTISSGGVYVNSGTGKFTISNTSNSISYGDASAIFLGLDSATPKLSLKGAGTEGLTWDGSSLSVTGTINVQNPGDFAGASLQEQFGGSSLDLTTWTINYGLVTIANQSMTFSGTTDEQWNVVSGDSIFKRANRPVFEWDVEITGANPNYVLGLWNADVSITSHYYSHYGVIFRKSSASSTKYIEARWEQNGGYSTHQDLVGSSTAWDIGDVFRCRISLLATGGYLEIFKNGNYTSPLYTHTYTYNTFENIKVIMKAYKQSNYTIDGIKFLGVTANGHLPMGTRIDGNMISTGQIESNNWSSSAGSRLNLDDGSMTMGGSSSPTLSVHANGDVTMTGTVTANAGSIAGWTIDSDKLFKDGMWLGKTGASGQNATVRELRVSSDETGTGNSNFVRMYIDSGTDDTWGIEGYADGNEQFHLGEITGTATNRIAGWTFDNTNFYKVQDSKYIGLTTNAHSDIADESQTLSSVFAGGTGSTGAGSTISISSDGKFRGNGIYRRGGKDWTIESSRLFGDGADGSWVLKAEDGRYQVKSVGHPQQSLDAYNGINQNSTDASNNGTAGGLGSWEDADDWGQIFYDSSQQDGYRYQIKLLRDVYLEKLEFEQASNDYPVIQTNGYRMFVRDRIHIGSGFSSSEYVRFRNRGEAGTGGSSGSVGYSNDDGSTIAGPSGTTGGGIGGTGGAGGTLRGGRDGRNGGNGGAAGGVSSQNGTSGTTGSGSSSGLGSYSVTLEGKTGAQGGNGGTGGDMSGGNNGGSSGPAGTSYNGGTATQAKTRIQHADPHLLTMFRDVYSEADDSDRISPSAGSSGGGGGGGGGGAYFQQDTEAITGGSGGEGGGAGGSGGTILICCRLFTSDGGKFNFDARGGDGGNGGDGGYRGYTDDFGGGGSGGPP